MFWPSLGLKSKSIFLALLVSEIDKGVRSVLKCDDLFDAKPAIIFGESPSTSLTNEANNLF